MKFCPTCGGKLEVALPATCWHCGTQHWNNPPCCAGALVLQDGKLLFIKRKIEPWQGAWDIPGGYCEPREHPMACAVRETKEETGLSIRITGIHGIWLDPPPQSQENSPGTICVYYLASTVGKAVASAPSHEAIHSGWFPLGQWPSEIAFPGHVEAVLSSLHAWHKSRRAPWCTVDMTAVAHRED